MNERVREEGGQALSKPGSRPWRGITAAASVGVFVIALTAALHAPSGDRSRYIAAESDGQSALAPATDPLMMELVRCRALPSQVDDPACRAAWEDNRRRFFGESRAMRVPGEPLPAYAPIPAPGSAPTATER